jgi:hypothetical protein
MPSIRTHLYGLAKALADEADRNPRLAEGLRRALYIDDNDYLRRRKVKFLPDEPDEVEEAKKKFRAANKPPQG